MVYLSNLRAKRPYGLKFNRAAFPDNLLQAYVIIIVSLDLMSYPKGDIEGRVKVALKSDLANQISGIITKEDRLVARSIKILFKEGGKDA